MEKDTDDEETDDDDALPQGPIVLKDKKDTDSEALVLRSVDESVIPGPSGLSTRTHIDDTYKLEIIVHIKYLNGYMYITAHLSVSCQVNLMVNLTMKMVTPRYLLVCPSSCHLDQSCKLIISHSL